jgi:hypothetical protein
VNDQGLFITQKKALGCCEVEKDLSIHYKSVLAVSKGVLDESLTTLSTDFTGDPGVESHIHLATLHG